jgi:hypothetical protein
MTDEHHHQHDRTDEPNIEGPTVLQVLAVAALIGALAALAFWIGRDVLTIWG